MRSTHLAQERIAMPHEKRLGLAQRLWLVLDDERNVEQVSRRGPVAAVVQFFRDDLRGRLDLDGASIDVPNLPSAGEQVRRRHKIDFTFLELQLDEAVAHLDVVLRHGGRGVAQTRRHKAQVLRIRYEDVDVLAQSVPVAKHQHGASAEGPERIIDAAVSLDLVDQRQCPREERPPGASGQRRGHHAQSA
jgi:hypothetical protein